MKTNCIDEHTINFLILALISLIIATKQNRMLRENIQLIKRKIMSYNWFNIIVLSTIRIIDFSEL